MFGQGGGISSLLKDGGHHFSGVDEALLRNIEACKNLTQITRTSLGPHGTNKLIINHIGKHFVTSATNTIIEELEVMHPAAKLLVMDAKMQEQECGDATNLVLSFGGELLIRAEELLKQGIHASDVLKGYELARDKALEYLDQMKVWSITDLKDVGQLTDAVKTAIAAKQFGHEDILAKLVAEACSMIMPPDPRNFKVDNVRVTTVLGGSIHKSFVVNGMAITKSPVGTETFKEKAKVAVYAQGIEAQATETKGTVLLENAEQLLQFSKGDDKRIEEFIKSIKDVGVDVVISGGHVSEMAIHYLNKFQILVLKIQSKFELQRICRTVNATSIIRFGPPTPEECGYVESICVEECASEKLTVIKSGDARVSTIVLRSASSSALEEQCRTIDNAVNVIRCSTKNPNFVAGAGATELQLASKLQEFGASVPGLDQYAVLKFAEAFEVVPKILADNAGHNHVDVVTALYAAHQRGDTSHGVDVESTSGGPICDAVQAKIFDHLGCKRWAITFALEGVLTVLQVDQIIMSKPAGGPKGPPDGQTRDED